MFIVLVLFFVRIGQSCLNFSKKSTHFVSVFFVFSSKHRILTSKIQVIIFELNTLSLIDRIWLLGDFMSSFMNSDSAFLVSIIEETIGFGRMGRRCLSSNTLVAISHTYEQSKSRRGGKEWPNSIIWHIEYDRKRRNCAIVVQWTKWPSRVGARYCLNRETAGGENAVFSFQLYASEEEEKEKFVSTRSATERER